MNVRVRFFASLRERLDTAEMILDLPEPAGFDELMRVLASRTSVQALEALRAENVRIAVNQTLTRPPFSLRAGDEVAFLPPVTGG